MPQVSAGLLLFRRAADALEVFLVLPGGPFFRNRDDGWWTVPKGLVEPGEEPLVAARREFEEETGFPAPAEGPYLDLGTVRQKGGKVVHAWAVEGECDPTRLRSNTFRLEWPAGSGKVGDYPEIARGAFFEPVEARRKINAAQASFLDRLDERRRERSQA